jgi:hypothetical protein
MWFAALGSARRSRWLLLFEKRLLEDDRTVLSLLARNPFAGAAPRYIRAMTSQYHFTDMKTWHATGNWWRTDAAVPYSPVLTLQEGRLAVANANEGGEP